MPWKPAIALPRAGELVKVPGLGWKPISKYQKTAGLINIPSGASNQMVLNFLATSGLTGNPISAWTDGTHILTAAGSARPDLGTDFKPGVSVDFNGTTDAMGLTPNPMDSSTGSIGFVFKTGGSPNGTVLMTRSDDGLSFARFYVDGTNSFIFEAASPVVGSLSLACNETAPEADTEYQVLITVNGTDSADVRIWINDVEQTFNEIGSGEVRFFNSKNLYAGSTNVPDEFFVGSIGVIRSWNYVLSAGERTTWSDYADGTWITQVGDIVSVEVLANGWEADVVIRGLNTGGTYAFGMGANNNPDTGTPKVVFTVVSLGYDNTGAATTISRTVWGVPCLSPNAVRKPYPDQLDPVESNDGTNTTIRIALSDYIYAKDDAGGGNSGTAPVVSILAGLYTESAVPNNASGAGFAVTNSSTVAYPKVIGHFANAQRLAVNGTEAIEVFAVHKYGDNGKPCAFVSVVATGADSSHTESGSATVMTLSARGDNIPVYAVSLDLSTGAGFTRGELVTINFTAYPWLGDSDSVLDATVDAGTEVFDFGPLYRTVMSKMIAVVDGIGGGTPTASTNQATADANPFATIALAAAGITAQNLADYTLTRVDGGEIQLKAATYAYVSAGTAVNGCVTICPHSSTNRAGVILAESSAAYQAKYMRLYNITITRGSNTYLIFAHDTNILIMEAIDFNDAHTAWYSIDANNSDVEFLDCISNNGYFSRGGNDQHTRLLRNMTYTATTEADNILPAGNASCVLGFKSTDSGSKGLWIPLASASSDNLIFAYCECYKITASEAILDISVDITNWAILNNVLEHTGAAASPLIEISVKNYSNLLIAHNTFAGQRFNHENDWPAPLNRTAVDYVGKFNAFNSRGNHRADIRAMDATIIGYWSVDNSVGWKSNWNEAIASTGDQDCWGINSNFEAGNHAIATPAPAGFVNDASTGGTDLGNGDYNPDTGSALLGLITTTGILPYDIDGTARTSTDAAGAYHHA